MKGKIGIRSVQTKLILVYIINVFPVIMDSIIELNLALQSQLSPGLFHYSFHSQSTAHYHIIP